MLALPRRQISRKRSRPIADVGKDFGRRGQEPVVRFPAALIFGHRHPES